MGGRPSVAVRRCVRLGVWQRAGEWQREVETANRVEPVSECLVYGCPA